MRGNGLADILLVEDNPADARLTMEALREGVTATNLHHVRDGVDAMKFLRQELEYADAPRPDLILLDLNMPRKDGREVLAEIKDDPDLRQIPVIVMTSSEAEDDIAAAYSLHANCYIRKPVQLDQFLQIVDAIQQFWLTTVKLPPSSV